MAVGIREIVITVVVLAICWYMGWLRPTGLAGRTSAQREEDGREDTAAKWLKKDGEGPQ
jgi:hypothetical protein